MAYICTEEKGIFKVRDKHNNWDYITEEKRSKRTESVVDVLNYAMEFIKKHPDAEFDKNQDQPGGFFLDDHVNEPNKPTYCFYVRIAKD